MKPANIPTGDALVESLTPFAPRLETYWFTCTLQVKYAGPGPRRVGKTARYLVHARDPTHTVLGEIAWSGTQNSYTFAASPQSGRWVAKALQDLSEICQYLTQRQRRLPAARRTS